MGRHDNTGLNGREAPEGHRVSNPARAVELRCFDLLPAELRVALADAAFQMDAVSALKAVSQGVPVPVILERIREIDEDLAVKIGTVPGLKYPAEDLRLRPRRVARPRR